MHLLLETYDCKNISSKMILTTRPTPTSENRLKGVVHRDKEKPANDRMGEKGDQIYLCPSVSLAKWLIKVHKPLIRNAIVEWERYMECKIKHFRSRNGRVVVVEQKALTAHPTLREYNRGMATRTFLQGEGVKHPVEGEELPEEVSELIQECRDHTINNLPDQEFISKVK